MAAAKSPNARKTRDGQGGFLMMVLRRPGDPFSGWVIGVRILGYGTAVVGMCGMVMHARGPHLESRSCRADHRS